MMQEAVAFSLLVRAPASRAGIPGSRPARSKNELGWCGPGGDTHVHIPRCCNVSSFFFKCYAFRPM